MSFMTNRARWIATLTTVVAGSLAVAACNVKQELLAPQNPGLVDPGAVANAAAAYALKVGAVGKVTAVVDCGGNSECLWEEVGNGKHG